MPITIKDVIDNFRPCFGHRYQPQVEIQAIAMKNYWIPIAKNVFNTGGIQEQKVSVVTL